MNKNLNITKKVIAKILSFFASLLFTKDLRHKYKTKILKLLMTPEPEELKQWQIMSNKETLQFINDTKCSIARFGDGEIGYMLDNKFKHFFQPYNKELQEKLRYILQNPIDNCLIALPLWLGNKVDDEYPIRFQVNYFDKMRMYQNSDIKYGSAMCFFSDNFTNSNIELIRQIWNNKNIVLVTGQGSTFVWLDELFKNSKSHSCIYTKAVDAFSEYEKIIEEVSKYPKDYIVIMALGLTATVLAYDLSKLGYQAIDAGHIVNHYLTATKGMLPIDILRLKGLYKDGKTDINRLIEEELKHR